MHENMSTNNVTKAAQVHGNNRKLIEMKTSSSPSYTSDHQVLSPGFITRSYPRLNLRAYSSLAMPEILLISKDQSRNQISTR